MASPVEDYLEKRAKFEQADQELFAITDFILTVGKSLNDNPETFSFTNTGVGLPSDIVMANSTKAINGNNWPSATNIMECLRDWHAAKAAMHGA